MSKLVSKKSKEVSGVALKCALVGVAMVLGAAAAGAQPPSVSDPGFELDVQSNGGFTTDGTANWVESGAATNSGASNPTTSNYNPDNPLSAPAGGTQVGFAGLGTRICQDVGGTLQAGNTYTLSAAVGWRNPLGTAPTYSLQIYNTAGGGGPGTLKSSSTGNPTSAGAFNGPVSVSYIPTGGDPDLGDELTICLETDAASSGQANFDEVTMTPVELQSFSIE